MKARQGLDKLLAAYPAAAVHTVDNQEFPDPEWVKHRGTTAARGPWTCVDLVIDGELTEFAVWNSTGNVYRLDEHKAVEDDPFIVVTPLTSEGS